MTTAEVAKQAGVHPDTVRKLVKNREISGDFIGGPVGYRFPETAPQEVLDVLRDRHERRARNRTQES